MDGVIYPAVHDRYSRNVRAYWLSDGQGLIQPDPQTLFQAALYGVIGLLLIANTVNIGADLGAMAASAQLLLGLPFIVWLLLITVVTLVMETFISYRTYAKYLKYLTLTLLLYIATAFLIQHNWRVVFFASFIPTLSLNKAYLLGLVAILGTNISPYLFSGRLMKKWKKKWPNINYVLWAGHSKNYKKRSEKPKNRYYHGHDFFLIL